jgi:hypothetical protein
MRHPGFVLTAGLTLAVAGCAATPPQNAARLAALPPARVCHARLPTFGRFPGGHSMAFDIVMPPHGRIAMDNDGGWCAIRFHFAVRGQIPVIARLHLVRPPAHGRVVLGTLRGAMRIAYRPAPGFTGRDRFAVRMGGPEPWVIPVRVRVAG